MIIAADHTLVSLLENQSAQLGVFSTQLICQYHAYGLDSGRVNFWLAQQADAAQAVFSVQGNCMTLAALPETDLGELGEFFPLTGASIVRGEYSVIQRLAAYLPHPFFQSAWIMRCLAPPPTPRKCAKIVRADSLLDVYSLLCAADPAFARTTSLDGWLTDCSHKHRHGLAEVYVLLEDMQPVCTGSLACTGPNMALIGEVATHPDAQRRGYGAQMVGFLARRAAAQGLIPHLFAARDSLAPFYTRCGFERAGRWGSAALHSIT